MTTVQYVLLQFDDRTDALETARVLVDADPLILRDLFNPEADSFPHLYNSYIIENHNQVVYIKYILPGFEKLNGKSYFVEASLI